MPNLLPPLASRRTHWAELTSGDTLFRHLQTVGESWRVAADSAWLDADPVSNATLSYAAFWWKRGHVDELPESEKDEAFRRWKIFAQMLWCFDEARRSERIEPSEIDRVALGNRLPAFDKQQGITQFTGDPSGRSADVARAYMWIRSFRSIEPSARAAVPVALYDTKEGSGFLATLTLEVMPGGVGEVADHPGAAFDVIHHDAFVKSIGRAWTMALRATSGEARVDGRWRVERRAVPRSSASRELRLVDGPSASGAAVRGWWHVLHNRIPDAEIVVLAQISKDGNSLETVDFVSRKVEAIVREGTGSDGHSAFDTIVVIGDRARKEAEEALGDNPLGIRVVSLG